MVKKVVNSYYEAADGTQFPTKEAAVAHDARHKYDPLVGMTAEDIDAIIAGDESAKAMSRALEALATKVIKARRDAGILLRPNSSRGKKAAAAPAPAPATAEAA